MVLLGKYYSFNTLKVMVHYPLLLHIYKDLNLENDATVFTVIDMHLVEILDADKEGGHRKLTISYTSIFNFQEGAVLLSFPRASYKSKYSSKIKFVKW